MKVDLTRLDEEIKKLEEVRRIASDPDLMRLLEKVIVNGSGEVTRHPSGSTTEEPNKQNQLSKFRDGSLVRAVADHAIAHHRLYTGYDLAQVMSQNGHQFTGKTKPGVIVADIIRSTLIPKGIVRIRKKGKGSDPTIYETIR